MSNLTSTRSRKKRYRRYKGRGLNNKQKAQVNKMISAPAEKKYYDTTFDTYLISLTPTFTDISAPAQGTAGDELIGSSINLESIQYRYVFNLGDDTNYIRFMIFQWFPDSENDLPSWIQMFQFYTGSAPVNLADLISPYQLAQGGTANFKVLLDEQFYLDTDNPIQIFKGFINKGFRKHLEVNGSSQQGTGHIFAMFVSDSGVVTHPHVDGYTRIRFTDS